MPKGRQATYLLIVVDFQPQKDETHRVRFIVRGDRINYKGNVTDPSAALSTAKLLLNSVLSDTSAKSVTVDLKDFYLGTPMDRYEYIKILVK